MGLEVVEMIGLLWLDKLIYVNIRLKSFGGGYNWDLSLSLHLKL